MTAERLKVCSELWKAGIKAETLYYDNPKPQRQLGYSFENGIPLIIWLGEDEIKQGIFKIKSLNTKEEVSYKREELVDVVKKYVQENPVFIPDPETIEMMKKAKKEEEKN